MGWEGISDVPALSPHRNAQHRALRTVGTMFSESVSPHCLQKLNATPLLVVFFKFHPEMLPNAEKTILD